MNISKPVSDSISSVDFTFLSSEDIKALSVKRIQCPTTFDNLLHPIPGGLYDTALGAWGDTPCATCHLNAFTCPGHPGHIELPVPVYHVTVFAQAYRLLGAKCCYCHNLRMSRVDVNRFVCKLRLVRHGLLPEVDMLDDLRRERDSSGQDDDKKGEESDESEDDATVMRRRAVFVSRAIRFTGSTFRRNAWINERNQAMLEKRRAIIRELMRSMNKGKRCHNCGGLSPRYRKDKFVKIFQRPLAAKDFDRMAKGGFELNSAMMVLNQQRQALAKRKSRGYEVDEGIVADVEEEEDGHREEDESSSSDTETSTDEDGNQVKDTAKLPEKKSRYSAAQRFVDAGEVHAALTLLFEKERELFNLVYDARPRSATQPPVTADVFFIRRLLVPPSRYRPEAHTGDGEIAEAQQNELYKAIMRQCATIHDIHREIKMRQTGDGVNEPGKRQRDVSDIRDVWIRLQEAVNSLLDRDRNPIQGIAARHTEDGIKQLLERKDGLFRKNMMGKRVNFAARSVISPDPNIETNEVGVPLVFAKKLTYPEPVTNHNFYEMKNAVLNGAMKWPGAMAIENENGQVVSLRNKNFEERQALANQLLAPSSNTVVGARNKKVHRHLNNGDIVLMNRQPTLHKPSIMGHRARVLPGEKTIRMHYANCNTYNADFDGDEMNMHFPQNEIARAEALQVADADHQYLVATSGKPLRGLIQDHLSMGVWLSNKDTFFDKHHYQQLLYSCLRPEENHTTSDRILTVPPAIIRPRPLWTGKQVVSTVLENIRPVAHPGLTLTSKSSTPGDRWHHVSEEGTVLFKDGELLCGVLDKSQLGPTVGGMIHSVYEVYGHSVAGKLLGIIGRLLTKLLHMRAFSCGVEDLILRKDGDAARREKLRSAKGIGLEVAAKYVTLEDQNVKDDNEELRSRLEDVFRSEEKRVGLDSVVNSRTQVLSSDITRECLPAGLAKQFPQNQMQTMTTSGAKGTIVNANLISCNLGQQILEGRRVPMMISGKTLPSFKPFDTDVRAGGYITDRFLTGIRPQEYYFHCMAGREGLIDTAVKTSRSGYLQRCLVKGLEGLKVEYDNSVRDTDGSVVQFLYGEDGLDITKQKHLMDFKFVAENFLSLFAQLNVREDLPHMLRDGAREWRKKSMKAVRRTGRIDAMDPVLAHFSPSRYMHSTSETFANALAEYQKSNPDGILQDTKKGIKGLVSKKNFELLMDLKYLKAIIEPGEAVGIVAGQSIGEPSTQMTLNTFHLAGHAAKNVTLGIPRLREIVMTASTKISTPVMTLYLRPELTEQDRERFAKAISRLSLAEIIENVTVNERIGSGTTYATARIYDIRIDFYPADEYCHEYALSTRDVGSALEQKLAPRLQKVIRAELKRRGANRMWTGATASSALPEVGESAGRIEEAAPSRRNVEGGEEGGDEDEDGDDDDDDDAANAKANRANDVAYDDGDDDDDNGDDDDRTAVRDPGASPSNADMTDEGIGSSPEPEGDEDDTDATPTKEFTRTRADRVKAFCKDITHFRFDEDEGQCCEMRVEYPAETPKILALNLVESSCRSVVLHAIPGIKSCTVSTEKKRDAKSNVEVEEAVVLTAGVNIVAMQEHPEELDPNRIMTNDIAGMLRHYGVEACRASIMREMDSVFKGHGITVDLRHLNLIADAMTRGGGFRPFSRIGLNANTSPFLKMSFETTTAFLRDAALEGDRDDLVSPSARLVLGKIGRAGTGAFDVLMPLYQSEDDDRGDDCGDLNGGGADVVGDDNGLDLV